MNIEQLYRDYGIPYVTENHKHTRDGWVNTSCPFCTGNAGYHLGHHPETGKWACWRCGGKNEAQAVAALLQVSHREVRSILKNYEGISIRVQAPAKNIMKKKFHLPPNSEELHKLHRKYLEGRGYDVEKLVHDWGLLGTRMESTMDKIDYSRRIVIPYYWDGEIVSFDTRDITGKAQNKYMACSDAREAIAHKAILYGRQQFWSRTGIIVEGTTDVWRFGLSSCATSGIKYTPAQVRCISKAFDRIAVCYDPDPQAKVNADKLVAELLFRGKEAFRVDLPSDPADMAQNEADYLVKTLLK